MTLAPLSDLFAAGRPGGLPIARSGGRLIVLSDFRADVAANAARLRATGCNRGQVMAEDSYWAAVGIFALLHAGASVVMPQHAGQPNDADTLRLVDRPAGADDFVLRPAETSGPCQLPSLDATSCRFALHTAGSTGAAKPVIKTLLQLERETAILDPLLARFARAGAWVHGSVPHYHLYGLTFRLAWPLASGRPFMGEQNLFWEQVLSSGIGNGVLVTSPAHLTRLGGLAPLAAPPDLILSAGAPLPASAVEDAATILGKAPVEIFGSTETGVMAWRERAQPGSGWRPFPEIHVERRPDGRIAIRSPLLPDGGPYFGEDLIEFANDGTFTLHGRADTVVKIEGKRTNLTELEALLGALEEVQDAAVIPLGDEPMRLGAAVVPSQAGRRLLSSVGAFRLGRHLRNALAARLDPALLPRQWRFVPALGDSPLGKRRRADLAGLFAPADSLKSGPIQPAVRATKVGAEKAELLLHVPRDLAYFDGHFPGFPLVPGVTLLDWAVSLGSQALALELDAAQHFQVKFLHPVYPGDDLALSIARSKDRLSFEYRVGERVVSVGKIALGAP